MERLEAFFKEFPEVAFVGCHAGKFTKERETYMVKQAVIRYDIHHPVINDDKFKLYKALDISNWPTLVVLGPDSKPLLKLIEEQNEVEIRAMVVAVLKSSLLGTWPALNTDSLPLQLESTKVEKRSRTGLNPEAVLALRQNLSHPGKVTTLKGKDLPYQTEEVLVIADSSNNRYVIVDAVSNTFIE